MGLLPFDTLLELHAMAVQQGLDKKRDVMLSGLNPIYVAILETNAQPGAQLMLDLTAMNEAPRVIGDVTPLHRWLVTAAALSAAFPERQRFYNELAEQVARAAGNAQSAPGDASIALDDAVMKPERFIFQNDLLPASFVTGAVTTARSVARIRIPQYEGGVARLWPSSGQSMDGFGTGWLIGQGFLVTNMHVVQARAPGEAMPSEQDLRLQCEAASAEFDFDFAEAQPDCQDIAGLAHGNAALDYAILRLRETSARMPLPLRSAPIALSPGAAFPVNVVQHPGGAAKQFGIRNNLAAAIRDDDIAYYTDTASGSSGSPVCDDSWRVIGLHKASTQSFGTLNFQGKDTVWVNVGTLITAIISDLAANANALWQEIAATQV